MIGERSGGNVIRAISTEGMTMTTVHKTIRAGIFAALLLSTVAHAACGEDSGESVAAAAADYSAEDLERLSFARADLPDMDYQPQRSGYGAFSGGEENREIAARLTALGLEEDYAAQFFATSRDSELGFVESTTLLFEDESSAAAAVDKVSEEYADFIAPAEEIDPPDFGEQPFGILGDFDGFPVYALGWRVGDVLQIVTVAPNGPDPSPHTALELAQMLAAKAGEGEA